MFVNNKSYKREDYLKGNARAKPTPAQPMIDLTQIQLVP